MASLHKMNGRTRLQFKGPDGKRKTLRLGKIDDRAAAEIKDHVEHLIECGDNPPLRATTAWLLRLKEDPAQFWLFDRLAAAGFVEQRPDAPARKTKQEQAAELRLGPFLQAYIDRQTDKKPATRTNWGHTQRNLVAFFGENRLITEITAGDARDFERYLKTDAREMRYTDAEKASALKPATVAKRLQNAKQFFADAVERELLDRNPFDKMKVSQHANRDRDHFVTRAVAFRVLEECPDLEWQAIFALSRFGGLRCPSEHMALTWPDIDWARDRMKVHSPKTEHHDGKAFRMVPLFPELRQILADLFHQAPEGATHVIRRRRGPSTNLRTQLERIIRRAGLEPWPKLFQNLRASCETDLMERFPAHVVVAWIGHTEAVARKHYLQVTEDHFRAASQSDAQGDVKSDAARAREPVCSSLHEPAKKQENPAKTAVFAGFSHSDLWAVGDSNL